MSKIAKENHIAQTSGTLKETEKYRVDFNFQPLDKSSLFVYSIMTYSVSKGFTGPHINGAQTQAV